MTPAAPTAATRPFVLLGDPVSHSLSPVFQNAAFRAAGVDAVYVAMRCAAAELPGLLRGIALAGGGGNVTVPHKEAAASAVERRTPAAARTNAVNAFWAEGGAVCGDNTDVEGVRAAVRALLGGPPHGARVLLVGAGGAARGAAYALATDGAASVCVLNRTASRAHELAHALGDVGARIEVASTPGALRGERFDLCVNATRLGLHARDALPLDPQTGVDVQAVLDLVYAPGETRWVHAFRDLGVPAADGLEMLLHQGAAAFRRWFSREPPLDVMRAALADAAGR